MNWIYSAQTGFPFTVYSPSSTLPDRVCDGNLPRGQRTATKWFDYNCFPTFFNPDGSTGVGDARPNVICGPGINNWDLGVHKLVRLDEQRSLEFRMEGFNLWNHTQLMASFNNANWFNNTASGAEITSARDPRQIQFALRFSF